MYAKFCLIPLLLCLIPNVRILSYGRGTRNDNQPESDIPKKQHIKVSIKQKHIY